AFQRRHRPRRGGAGRGGQRAAPVGALGRWCAGPRAVAGARAFRRADRPALQHRPHRGRDQGQHDRAGGGAALRLPPAAVDGRGPAAGDLRRFRRTRRRAFRGDLPRTEPAVGRHRPRRGAPPGRARRGRRPGPADRQRGGLLDRGLAVLRRWLHLAGLRPGRHRPGPYRRRVRDPGPAARLRGLGSPHHQRPALSPDPFRTGAAGPSFHRHPTVNAPATPTQIQTRQTIVRLLSSMASAKEISQYLKRFSQVDAKRFAVVKVGGAVLRDELEDLTYSLTFLQEVGLTPIVLHGAGPQLDAELSAAGIQKQTVNGLRETTPEDLGIVRRVFQASTLKLVEALQQTGARARSITGGVCEAEYMDQATYGLGGEVRRVNLAPIEASLKAGSIPVITSLGEAAG